MKTQTITMKKFADEKNSVLYKPSPAEENPIMTSCYIRRTSFLSAPPLVEITIIDPAEGANLGEN